VRIGADHTVRIGDGATVFLAAADAAGEKFQVHLVNDAHARRHDLYGFKGLLSPFEEFIAFTIAFEFQLHVGGQRFSAGVMIHLDRMIHDQIRWNERLDLFGISAQTL